MKNFTWLFRFLVPYKDRLALAVLLGFLAIAANVGLMGTSGYLIAAAALHPSTILLLWVPIVGVRFFGIARSVFRYLERLASHDLTFRILAQVRVWFYDRLERLQRTLLQQHRSSDVLAAAVTDVESLQNLYLNVVAPPLVAILVGLLSVILIARYSTLAGVLFGVCYGISGGLVPWLSLRLGERAGVTQVSARTELQAQLGDALAGMTELLVDGRTEAYLARLEEKQKQLTTALRQRNTIVSVSAGTFVFITNASLWLTLFLLIPLVRVQHVPGVEVPSLLFIVLASFEAVMPLPAAMQALSETKAAAKRIRKFVQSDEAAADGTVEFSGGHTETVGAVGVLGRLTKQPPPVLEVQDLRVRYSPDEPEALRGIHLRLQPRERMAVVGESGSGKSTLIHALLRLCPYEGHVFADGVDTSCFDDEKVRNLFSVVTQDAFLFHVSVADNLRLAKPGASLEELRQAVGTAQALDLMDKLTFGFETVVGEGGTRFSGGERQRLALARAILRDAPILLLDEPTRGLDAVTEMRFLEALWRAAKDRSVLYITHRLIGLEHMDTILVMQNGQIVEQGTYHELAMRPDSLFFQMLQLERNQLNIATNA
ncbi:thiol reductant ABC exporter subunit CydC [Alicyclobacillus mengziensis]|uniref:Thiol reductant ABC exporter subunit CydC n=1 Tax=Alicyclobacillus mengziensis TaxID=2931921 RepID=A0A9X7Z660_9BACL|nr:thiol reductant ABC exporter subunit CydC [Alicyclobacillus mengziensis]QSO47042.1 thiol reductant ABC exporter subunit CydC [Alicyclobacillus mengziensis]